MFIKIKTFIEKEFPKEKNIIYIAFFFWFIFLILSFIFSSGFETKYEWLAKINPGTWGDSFGILNSLISVITFFLVYKTFGLQKDMLASQKKELEATRDEMRGQKEIMEAQLKGTNNQNVRSFIQFMIEGLRRTIDGVSVTVSCTANTTSGTSCYLERTIYGKDAFHILTASLGIINIEEYQFRLVGTKTTWYEKGGDISLIKIKEILSHIEEYINNNLEQASGDRKNLYINLIKSELRTNEITILNEFYKTNGFTSIFFN